MTSDSIGVDISKDHLDVHRLSSGAAARFPNSSAGFRALAAWLSSEGVERVVYEPTGPITPPSSAPLPGVCRWWR